MSVDCNKSIAYRGVLSLDASAIAIELLIGNKADMDMNDHQTESYDASFRVLIINSSGGSTKTTTGKGLVKNRMKEPMYYRIGYKDVHKGRNKNEHFATADQFPTVYKALTKYLSAIVEVEVSACEATLYEMENIHGRHEEFDFVLVPTINSSPKLISDSIRTIERLISIGFPPQKIRVLFNRVPDKNDYFKTLTDRLEELKIPYNLKAQLEKYSFYEELDILNIKYKDITESKVTADRGKLEQLKFNAGFVYSGTVLQISRDYLIEAISAQREALVSKQKHDEVFEILFDPSYSV